MRSWFSSIAVQRLGQAAQRTAPRFSSKTSPTPKPPATQDGGPYRRKTLSSPPFHRVRLRLPSSMHSSRRVSQSRGISVDHALLEKHIRPAIPDSDDDGYVFHPPDDPAEEMVESHRLDRAISQRPPPSRPSRT